MNNSKIQIIDNFIDPPLAEGLRQDLLYNVPHKWGHVSDRSDGEVESYVFYSADLEYDELIYRYIHFKIDVEILNQRTNVGRVYINVQHPNMGGRFHLDDGDITALLMITKTTPGEGEFEYIDEEGKIKKVDFVHNRLILFEGSKIKHRGVAPITPSPRITLAYKLNYKNV